MRTSGPSGCFRRDGGFVRAVPLVLERGSALIWKKVEIGPVLKEREMIRHALFRHALYCLLAFALISPAPVRNAAAEVTIKGVEEIVFTEVEKRLIKEFFGKDAAREDRGREGKKAKKAKKAKKMPPGLAQRESLPPGLAKRQVLPPGLAKRDLPAGLESMLPKGRPGTVRQIVDDEVVLIEKATGKVLDILVDVIKSQ